MEDDDVVANIAAFSQGKQAYLDGIYIDENPYASKDVRSQTENEAIREDNWNEGWCQERDRSQHERMS